MDPNNIEATVEGIPPRGDLIASIIAMVEERMQAKIIAIPDPISGAVANVIIQPDGTVRALPAATFDDYLEGPRFRKGTANLTSLTSFIAHVNRFRDGESVVFACDDRTKPSLTAVLDYSPMNREVPMPDREPGSDETGIGVFPPRHGRHRSHFAFPLSDEWQAWNKQNAKEMSIADFATFLEDRIGEVAYPGEIPLSAAAEEYLKRIGGKDRMATPSDLVVLSRGLRINENAEIKNAVNLASGEGQISFATEHTGADGQPLSIPSAFQIAIPVFRNGDTWAVLARLRYRVKNGAIVFFYELWRTDLVFDAAFNDDAERVKAETSLPVLLGAPEA